MSEINFSHVSVLLSECIEGLDIRDGYTYVDCTTGGGGHSLEIAKRLKENNKNIIIFFITEYEKYIDDAIIALPLKTI